jgi:hypothetical protein
MTDRENILYYLIDCSAPNKPAQRKDLIQLVGLDDRQVREIISNLQLEGKPIFAAGRGYFYAHKNEDDLKAASKYISSEYSRGRSITKKAKVMYRNFKKEFNRVIPSLEEQPTLF